MSKTYSSKSNANRAASKLAGATVEQNEAGLWMVVEALPGDEVPAKSVEQVAPEADADAALQTEMDAQAAERARQAAEAEQPVIEQTALGPVTQPVYMVLSITVLADDAATEAQALANFAGQPVCITSQRTGNVVQTVAPNRAAKAVRAPKAAREPKAAGEPKAPAGRTLQVIEMASRAEGVTRPQLTAAIGWGNNAPWTTILKQAASRAGLSLNIEKSGGKATYYMVPHLTA